MPLQSQLECKKSSPLILCFHFHCFSLISSALYSSFTSHAFCYSPEKSFCLGWMGGWGGINPWLCSKAQNPLRRNLTEDKISECCRKIIFIKRIIRGGILFRDFIPVPIRNGSHYIVLIFCTMKQSEDKKKILRCFFKHFPLGNTDCNKILKLVGLADIAFTLPMSLVTPKKMQMTIRFSCPSLQDAEKFRFNRRIIKKFSSLFGIGVCIFWFFRISLLAV